MIIVKLMGGLGNQMFQYAAAMCLAEVHKATLKLDLTFLLDRAPRKNFTYRNYELNVFNIQENFATPEEIKQCKVINESYFHFDKNLLNVPDNVYLEDYWQSEKYFKNIEDVIKNDFTVKTEPDEKSKDLLNKIKNSNAVSIHVRRRDYVTNPLTNSVHGVCSLDYYKKCIDLIAKRVDKPQFFIFSDDPKWAKKNLKIDWPNTYISHNGLDKGYEDLRLMSNCKHFIIANSSFSWWGAWLCENQRKITIAPKKWFNGKNINTDDIIPETWLRI